MEFHGQCRHTKPDGSRCRANGRTGSGLCFAHDPALRSKRDAARRAGGRKRAAKVMALPPDTPDLPLASMADVASLLAVTINQTRRGELDPRVANSLGYLGSVLVKALEQSDLERRIQALEDAAATRHQKAPTELSPNEPSPPCVTSGG
jgi:hypothetical protein